MKAGGGGEEKNLPLNQFLISPGKEGKKAAACTEYREKGEDDPHALFFRSLNPGGKSPVARGRPHSAFSSDPEGGRAQ